MQKDAMRGKLGDDGNQRAGETFIYRIRVVSDNAALDHIGYMLAEKTPSG